MPDSLMPSDIATEADIRTLVEAFYGDIAGDPVLGPFFQPVDLPAHLPRMVAFWSSVVFQTGAYRGRPFDAHLKLEALQARHFERWLERFCTTVDAHFRGPNADLIKARAKQIAAVFQIKMGLLPVLG